MTNRDNSIRPAEAYDMAFRVGLVGTIILTVAGLLDGSLAWLVALAVWSMIVLFVLPVLYVWFSKTVGQLPNWSIKGPHQ
jgi:hypothetical protein